MRLSQIARTLIAYFVESCLIGAADRSVDLGSDLGITTQVQLIERYCYNDRIQPELKSISAVSLNDFGSSAT